MSKNNIAAAIVATAILFAALAADAAPAQPVLRIKGGVTLTKNGRVTSGVYLQSLEILVDVTGNIASTRYRMVFKNNSGNVLEGELDFPLPDGANVNHYALDVDGWMREAVPVAKAAKAHVFEEMDSLQAARGLLEKATGGSFRARVYPIPAKGERTVSIGYTEELPLENGFLRYSLPLAYPDTLDFFDVRVTVWRGGQMPVVPDSGEGIRFNGSARGYAAIFERENYKPTRPLIFALPAAEADAPHVMMQKAAQEKYYFLASVAPKSGSRKKRWGDNLAIVWDVSLSASQRDLRREMEALGTILAEKKKANVHLYFLNNRLKKMSTSGYKVTNGNWGKLKAALDAAIFDGGTDFSQINLNDIAGDEILFFSDGISTLSDANFLKNSDLKRPIHCIVSSPKADYGAMKLIAGRTMGKFININALSSDQLKPELLYERLQFLGIEAGRGNDAISEVYPSLATPVLGNFSVAGISSSGNAEMTLLFGKGREVTERIPVKLNAKEAAKPVNVYKVWAQKKIAELDLDYEANRAEIAAVGQKFGIVTRNTSLAVLESAKDYARYGISPPQGELQDEYLRLVKESRAVERDLEREMLASATKAAKAVKKWWNTDFADIFEFPAPERLDDGAGPAGRWGWGMIFGRGYGVGSGSSGCYMDDLRWEKPPVIKINPIKKDRDYLGKLTGNIAEDYRAYLALRETYAYSPAFYFDMADWFYTHKDKETGLRILTSVAELGLKDASLYRLLGYKLKEYGDFAPQLFVCKKVISLHPAEAQSYRDYALALYDFGYEQAALDSLYSLLTKPYAAGNYRRSYYMEEVVVTEMNRLIAKNATLNTSKIKRRLMANAPVDIRVVINWSIGYTGTHLYVLDPTGVECYYGNHLTSIGGRIGKNNMSGHYGPTQFMLKNAVKGKYKIYVKNFDGSLFTPHGPSTLMAEIFTRYAGEGERREVVCFQLSNAGGWEGGKDNTNNTWDKVMVAGFEF